MACRSRHHRPAFPEHGLCRSQAVLLAVLFLPGMLCARYFYPQLTFEDRERGVFNAVYLTLAILCTEYLAIALGHLASLPEIDIPGLLLNPLFILLVLSACIFPEMLIESRLEARRPYDRTLRFVSDRRPVALDPAEVLYVESNDSEVWLHTRSGEPTARRRAFHSGKRCSTVGSCASTAPISSIRSASKSIVRPGSGSAVSRSKSPANTRKRCSGGWAANNRTLAPRIPPAPGRSSLPQHRLGHAADRREGLAHMLRSLVGRAPHDLVRYPPRTGASVCLRPCSASSNQWVRSVPSATWAGTSRRAASRTAAARPPGYPSPRQSRAQRSFRNPPRPRDVPWAGPSDRCGDHEPCPCVVHDHPAGRLHTGELRGKGCKRPPRDRPPRRPRSCAFREFLSILSREMPSRASTTAQPASAEPPQGPQRAVGEINGRIRHLRNGFYETQKIGINGKTCTQMKKIILIMAIAAVGLGSCEKRPQPLMIDNALTDAGDRRRRLTPEVMWKMSRAGGSSLARRTDAPLPADRLYDGREPRRYDHPHRGHGLETGRMPDGRLVEQPRGPLERRRTAHLFPLGPRRFDAGLGG